MNEALPEICDHPLIQADDLRFYISRRLKAGNLDLYSAFMLSHEATRIGRLGYLQSAWGHELSISGLLKIYMNGLTATAFGVNGIVDKSRDWFAHDMDLLAETRTHFFTSAMRDIDVFDDTGFLTTLCKMRDNYNNLPDDDGPYHNEFFPWHYASPERHLLDPKSNSDFIVPKSLDPEIESLIIDLNIGKWGNQ